MGHTNSTTNYNLPQFMTTDKPAWLTDINGAFNAIDTGMHNAQTKADTADNNATQALTDAANAATAAATADGKGAGALASTSDAFSTTDVYSVGDHVIYNNLLYRCTTAVAIPGPWTGSANWTRTTLEEMFDSLKYEEFSSGVWTWRKYADGTLEMWGESDEDYEGTFNPWGSIFSLDVPGLGAYPIPFTRIDSIEGSCALGGANAVSSLTNFSVIASVTTAPSYILVRGTNIGSGTRNLYKSLYIKGIWN